MTSQKLQQLNDFLSQTINWFEFGKELRKSWLISSGTYTEDFLNDAVANKFLISRQGFKETFLRLNSTLKQYVL